MNYVIGRQFTFCAAHHLDRLPPGHKCTRVHGHTYTVEVQLASDQLDSVDMVCDFADLDSLGEHIAATMDHRDLNQALNLQPTCERIAEYLYRWCRDNSPAGPLVAAVRVSESPRTWAEYRPGIRTDGAR